MTDSFPSAVATVMQRMEGQNSISLVIKFSAENTGHESEILSRVTSGRLEARRML
jgi:hypothetical protein